MQVTLVIFPADNGLNVVVWGRWTKGTMRTRYFESRSEMITVLADLQLINHEEALHLDAFVFSDKCPVLYAEVDETVLAANGFEFA